VEFAGDPAEGDFVLAVKLKGDLMELSSGRRAGEDELEFDFEILE
jgi:hypothetical protein